MEIQELWRVVSQRWRIVVIVTLLCVSLALAWSLARPVTYKAQGRVTIATSGSLGTAGDAYSGEQVAIQRAPTYAELLKGPEVAARASQKLHGEISAQSIQDSLDALGFNLVGYGCTTCIGNSGPLPQAVGQAVKECDLVVGI